MSRRVEGRVFYASGPEKENARSPMNVRHLGSRYNVLSAEHRSGRVGLSVMAESVCEVCQVHSMVNRVHHSAHFMLDHYHHDTHAWWILITIAFQKHPVDYEAQLAWKCSFTPVFFRRPTLIRKLGQTDLVFGVQSGFISRSVHARLQVSCAAVMICTSLVNIQTHTYRQHFKQLIWIDWPAHHCCNPAETVVTCSICTNVLVDLFLDLGGHRQPICANSHIRTSLNDSLWRPLVTT